ncbi:unnamed protein product [Closterium sp. NIES-54]
MQSKQESSEEELKVLKGNVSMGCIDEHYFSVLNFLRYNNKEDVYFERFLEAAEVTLERNAVKQEHEGLIRRRQEEFTAGIDAIRMRVKEIYQIMAPGGDTDLAPVDPLDPFSHGICFSVRPPQQQCLRSVADLDGGEQVRTAVFLSSIPPTIHRA